MSAYVSDAMDKMQCSTSVEQAVQDSDLVIEAIIENVEIKQKLFKTLEQSTKE